MWYTATSSSETKSRADRYTEGVDNVKDIKDDLSKLKKSIALTEKVASVDTKMWDQEYTWEKAINDLDNEAENIFDAYVEKNESIIKQLVQTNDIETLTNMFNEEVWKNIDVGFAKTKDLLEKEWIEPFQFELNVLADSIRKDLGASEWSAFLSNINNSKEWTNNNTDNNTSIEKRERREWYHADDDYEDAYNNPDDITRPEGEYEIKNIYKDSKLKKIMEEIFDDEDKKELRAGTFNINLSKEDGLAGIIIALRELAPYAAEEITENDPDLIQKSICRDLWITYDPITKEIKIWWSQADIKKTIKYLVDKNTLNMFKYKWAGDFSKIAKILTRAKRTNLDTFAGLVQSKDDVEMVVQEWHNTETTTGNILNEKDKRKYDKENYKRNEVMRRESLINSENVLTFLCDVNGDGTLSTEYNKQLNIAQENQGDVGTLSGPQIMFTIDQAIGVKDAEGENGENVVIHNIVKNMKISDRNRIIPEVQKKLIDEMMSDETKCTKDNLVKIINGIGTKGKDGYVEWMPEFKIFFLDAIKKISGGSDALQPDLYNVLVGDDADALIENFDEGAAELEKKIDELLTESKDPAIIEMIRTQGLVRVRETVFTTVMRAMDNITITGNDGAITQLQAAGIGKNRVVDTARNEILKQIIQSLVSGAIHYSKEGWLRLTIGIGENGITESGRTKRSRWGEGGIIVWGKKWISLYIGGAAEIAEQYNYKNVINANLSQVKSAKYLGAEWEAGAQFSITDGVGVEVSGGIDWKQDPVVGINQLDKQYEDISNWIKGIGGMTGIFDISTMSESSMVSKQEMRSHIQHNMDRLKTKGKYKKFIENNTRHLKDNLDFVIDYLDTNGFFGDKGKIALLENNKKAALQNLLTILQSGNREERRSNVISWLHEKISLTKLSFGITTSPATLTLHRNKNWVTWEATSWGDELPWDIQTGWGESEWGLKEDRFGIAGLYVGARISTWRNSYVPNALQYLYTEYEMWQGIWAKKLESKNNVEKDLETYVKYLEAFYNTDNILKFTVEGGKIKAQLTTSDKDMTIQKYLNIHATTEAEKNFSFEDKNTLIIGNVGPIWTYTVAGMKGVRRILCLGTQKLDDAHRIQETTVAKEIDAIVDQPGVNKERTQVKIHEVADKMTGTWTNTPIETVKSETKSFFDENGKLDIPTGKTVEYKNCTIWQTFKNGTLTITKNTDWTSYEVSYATSPADKLTINYIDEKEYKDQIDKPENRTEKVKTPVENLFTPETTSEIYQAKMCLNTLATSIYNLEHTDKDTERLYMLFISSASAIIDGVSIDDGELDTAIWYLKELLPKNSIDLEKLDTYLTSGDWYTKTYVVDRLKQIFAKEDRYTEGKSLSNIIFYGRTWRKTIAWPSWDTLPSKLITEFESQKQIWQKEKYTSNPEIHPDLIWYTAFYRTYGWIQQTKNYSMTSLGDTASQVDLHPVNNVAETKEWFMNNFKNNEKEVEYFAEKLEKQFKAKWVDVVLKDKNYDTTRSNIEKMLWDGILLDSWEKISIDVDYVFYLLGECCNESLGMEIKTINIQETKEDIVIKWRYTATGESEKEWENGVNIYSQSNSLPSTVESEEEKVGGVFHKHTDIFDPTGRATSWWSKNWATNEEWGILTWSWDDET